MATISQFILCSGPEPSEDNKRQLWRCKHQASIGAIIEGLEQYEHWTACPASIEAMTQFADQIKFSSQKWNELGESELRLLICVLSSLQFSASYYVMIWLEYRSNSDDSCSMKLADVALKMQQSSNQTEQLAGQRMWKRIASLVKISSAQGVLADTLYQKIMVD
ncbi:MAG: hypothetical protein Q9M92_10795 [Enterobacterales bacterium]|nr:hypothetical protein [Enterobacterales bacterium]